MQMLPSFYLVTCFRCATQVIRLAVHFLSEDSRSLEQKLSLSFSLFMFMNGSKDICNRCSELVIPSHY